MTTKQLDFLEWSQQWQPLHYSYDESTKRQMIVCGHMYMGSCMASKTITATVLFSKKDNGSK